MCTMAYIQTPRNKTCTSHPSTHRYRGMHAPVSMLNTTFIKHMMMINTPQRTPSAYYHMDIYITGRISFTHITGHQCGDYRGNQPSPSMSEAETVTAMICSHITWFVSSVQNISDQQRSQVRARTVAAPHCH